MKWFPHILFLLLSCLRLSSYAQEEVDKNLYLQGICDEKGYCIPKLQGLPPPKGVEIRQQRIYDYRMDTRIEDSNYTSDIRRNRRWDFKLRLPVLMKDQFKLIVGLGYSVEEYAFDEGQILNNEFYQNLEDKPLRRLRSVIYAARPFKGDRFLLGRASFSLNGDFRSRELGPYLKSAVAAIYGKRASASKSWGVGLSYSYTFGDLAIYPLFTYNKQLTPKTGFEMLLPVHLSLRYYPNERNVLYITAKLEGDNYNLNFQSLSEETLFLGRSDLLSYLTYERQIYDFIWCNVSAGIRGNLNFDLADGDGFADGMERPFIDNSLATAFFTQMGIFLVPPKKWLNK